MCVIPVEILCDVFTKETFFIASPVRMCLYCWFLVISPSDFVHVTFLLADSLRFVVFSLVKSDC